MSKNSVVKLLLVFGSLFGVFLMTGLLYFRNDVQIRDEGEIKTVYTVSNDPYEILRENNIELGIYDEIDFTGFELVGKGGTAILKIDRAAEIPVIRDGEEIAKVYNIDTPVGELLEQFGVEYGEYDKLTPSKNGIARKGDSIEIATAYDVELKADGESYTAKCYDTPVAELIERAGLELGEYDAVNMPLDKVISEPCTIEIYRAYDVKIVADGKTVTVPCYKNTVSQLLERAGIEVDSDDIIDVSLNKKITKPCTITVKRVDVVSETEIKTIPYETEYFDNNLLVIGGTKVTTEGVNGEEKVTTTTTYIDGKAVNVEVSSEVIKEKTNEVVARGIAEVVPYSQLSHPEIEMENGRPVNYEYMLTGDATAYSARPGAGTASGRRAVVGTVAVNPNVIPYGSLVYIIGTYDRICYGYAIAADTGDGMMSGELLVDVFMGSYEDSCLWGRHTVDLYVISVGNG